MFLIRIFFSCVLFVLKLIGKLLLLPVICVVYALQQMAELLLNLGSFGVMVILVTCCYGIITGITRHIPGNIVGCSLIAVAAAGTALCAGMITALLEEAVSGLTRLLVS